MPPRTVVDVYEDCHQHVLSHYARTNTIDRLSDKSRQCLYQRRVYVMWHQSPIASKAVTYLDPDARMNAPVAIGSVRVAAVQLIGTW